ncbi:MAG TPA: hypothetical protein VHO24_13340 [Opitutaceae bacterium]|nr:hypothetical protein [Opitutaceae bacterium]
MCASPLSFFRAGPPPPNVALLPDSMFFTRMVPVAAGATTAEVAAQVELALEALSPFPVTQLYHGYYWKTGGDRALVFAAYRRRFTAEQTAAWASAELVLPAFAATFGAEVAPATTLMLTAPEGLTAVHWESGSMPGKVLFRPLIPESTDEDRARVRDELVRAVGGSRSVVDLSAAPAAEPKSSDNEIVFRAGGFGSRLPTAIASGMDVRDKAQLAQLRRAQLRDLWMWRTALGCVVAILLLIVGEFALLGGNKLWQKSRLTKLASQRPVVEKIDNAQKVANRIEELATKRLLPMEMLSLIYSKKPESTQLLRATTNGLNTMIVEAQTGNAGEVGVYKTALRALNECEKVETTERTVNNITSFVLTVTFKPGSIVPTTPIL